MLWGKINANTIKLEEKRRVGGSREMTVLGGKDKNPCCFWELSPSYSDAYYDIQINCCPD
jgi:hypothetical protein